MGASTTRTLTIHRRHFSGRAERSRFKNAWTFPEIRLGGQYCEFLRVVPGDRVRVVVGSPGTLNIAKRVPPGPRPDGTHVLSVVSRQGHPSIQIAGLWLQEAGFVPGGYVAIDVVGPGVLGLTAVRRAARARARR